MEHGIRQTRQTLVLVVPEARAGSRFVVSQIAGSVAVWQKAKQPGIDWTVGPPLGEEASVRLRHPITPDTWRYCSMARSIRPMLYLWGGQIGSLALPIHSVLAI